MEVHAHGAVKMGLTSEADPTQTLELSGIGLNFLAYLETRFFSASSLGPLASYAQSASLRGQPVGYEYFEPWSQG